MVRCLDCDAVPPLCDRCVEAKESQLKGTAMARGYAWGEAVARRLGPKAPAWPDFGGRARVLAMAKVAELAGDERLLERLAMHCWADAKRRYERLRGVERPSPS